MIYHARCPKVLYLVRFFFSYTLTIYLSACITVRGRSFADDTNLMFSACNLSVLRTEMSKDLHKMFTWLCSNKLTLNILKTEFMVIGSRQRIATLEGDIAQLVNGITLQKVRTTNCLRLSIDEFLTWDTHMQSIRHKVTCNLKSFQEDQTINL